MRIFGFLAAAAGIYSILIIVRIIISWFSTYTYGRPVEILSRITDPYLDFWREKFSLRIGFLDFSAVLALVSLSLMQRIFYAISSHDVITIGYILAIVLISVWSVISFILGFCFIVIILRLIAYLTNRNIYSPFWRIIDSISQPLLYKFNRLFFGNRIGNYLNGILLSSLLLLALWLGGRITVPILANFLVKLPL